MLDFSSHSAIKATAKMKKQMLPKIKLSMVARYSLLSHKMM